MLTPYLAFLHLVSLLYQADMLYLVDTVDYINSQRGGGDATRKYTTELLKSVLQRFIGRAEGTALRI